MQPLDRRVFLVSPNKKFLVQDPTFPTNRGDEDIAHTFSKDDSSKKLVLPIDKYREEILRTIKQQRVTIIHGETGCGKSSRVPCFLLRADPPQPSLAAPEVKMVISQPRRIAAKALAERIEIREQSMLRRIECEVNIARAKARGEVDVDLEKELKDLRVKEAHWQSELNKLREKSEILKLINENKK